MVAAAKVGGGVLLAGLIGTGGIAFAKPEWLGIGRMPGYYSLSLDNEYSETNYADTTFGGKHKYLLVGVTKSKTFQGSFVESKSSQPWWEWAYKRLKKDTGRTGKWADITSGYTDNVKTGDEKALNKVCNDAYKKQNDELDQGDEFKKSDIWKYCSEGGKQPTTIQEYNTSLGNTEDQSKKEEYKGSDVIGSTEKSKLLSVKDKGNDWAWELKDVEFWFMGLNGQPSIPEGRFKTAQTNLEKLKDVCAEAYAKAPSTDSETDARNKINKDEVIKYCSL